MMWFPKYILKFSAEDLPLGNPADWAPGQKVILNVGGLVAFVVCRVITWDQIGQLSDDLIAKDKDTVVSPNPFGSSTYNRHEGSIVIQVIESYGSGRQPFYEPGTVHIVGPQNLYRTMSEYAQKHMSHIFTDIYLNYFSKPIVRELLRDHPDLAGPDPASFIDYENYIIRGYEVLAVRDGIVIKRNKKPILGQKENEWYWYIPEAQVRSLYMSNKIYDIKNEQVKHLWWEIFGQGGHFKTPDEAAASAEKFINHFIFMEDA